jgi:tripartite-type tricarboxylate transporter receptor subunit TctC
MRVLRKIVLAGFILAAFHSLAAPAAEPAWPAKPIRIISPLGSGGSGDALARMVGEALSDSLGQPVVVDNRPGANGIIGVELVTKAAPDGYTLLVASGGNVAINPALYGTRLPFRVETDLMPVMLVATQTFVLHVSPAFAAQSVREVVALARAKPGVINYASAGAGSTAHLMAVLFETMTEVRMTHVPYKSAAQGRVAVMSRESDAMFDGLLATLPLIKAGRLRALGVTSSKRSQVAPDIPTIAEAGVPGYGADAWYGMFVPRGTPAPVIARLSATMGKALHDPVRREKLLAQGVEPAGGTPVQLAEFLKAETVKWAKVIQRSGVKPD